MKLFTSPNDIHLSCNSLGHIAFISVKITSCMSENILVHTSYDKVIVVAASLTSYLIIIALDCCVYLIISSLCADRIARTDIEETCRHYSLREQQLEWRRIRIHHSAKIYGLEFKVKWPLNYDGNFICDDGIRKTIADPINRAIRSKQSRSFYRLKGYNAEKEKEYGCFQYFSNIKLPCVNVPLRVAKILRLKTETDPNSRLAYVPNINSTYLQKDYSLNRYIYLDAVASTGVALGHEGNSCFMIDTHPQRSSVDRYLESSFWCT